MAEPLDLFGQRAASDSFDRIFACGVDVCDQQKFGAVKRSCKVIFQIAGASISVGLKQGHYSPPGCTSCRKRCPDLRRMMTVIINHQPSAFFTFNLKPAFRSSKFSECTRNVFELDAKVESYRYIC